MQFFLNFFEVLLYELSSGHQIDGSPLVAIRKQWLGPADSGPRKMVRHHSKMIELSMFWIMTLEKAHSKRRRAYIKD